MKLIAYSSSEGGGMMGGYSSTSIAYTDDGRCKVNKAGRTFHSEPIRKETYYADGLLEKLSEVCERYRVIEWENLPGETVTMLDAPSGSDSFTFENGTKIILESRRIYPGYVYEMHQEVNKLIEESKRYGVDFEVTEEAASMLMFGQMMKTGKVEDVNGQNPGTVQTITSQNPESIKWAKFCAICGTEFQENQKFCSECGSVRPKL